MSIKVEPFYVEKHDTTHCESCGCRFSKTHMYNIDINGTYNYLCKDCLEELHKELFFVEKY